ncbi:MAG: ABC transporter permease, partial [Actinomyces sp.]|nr:ABC transporter permease [Actinomyces sp.]
PEAARTAGISVGKITAITMAISGAFLGLAGANEALGTVGYVSRDIAGSIGFDAITVALLGRNKPLGTLGAGILFGAFKAGGYTMQAKGVPIDMILILQSVIVLLIAAPMLVRWLFHLPKETKKSLRAELAELSGERSEEDGQTPAMASAVKEDAASKGGDAATDGASTNMEGEAR